MANGWIVTFYGANTSAGYLFPSITTVQGISGVVSVTQRISRAVPQIINQGERLEKENNQIDEYPIIRAGYEVAFQKKRFPRTDTTLQSFFPISFLKMKHKYIDWGDYNLHDSSAAKGLNCEAIVWDGDFNMSDEQGWVELSIPLKSKGTM